MEQISSISRLAEREGCKSLKALGRHYYDNTECGVSTEFFTMRDSFFDTDDHYGVVRDLPNVWAGHYVCGIRFHSIIEGSEAEVSSDFIYFPCEYSEIEAALKSVEDQVDEVLETA